MVHEEFSHTEGVQYNQVKWLRVTYELEGPLEEMLPKEEPISMKSLQVRSEVPLLKLQGRGTCERPLRHQHNKRRSHL